MKVPGWLRFLLSPYLYALAAGFRFRLSDRQELRNQGLTEEQIAAAEFVGRGYLSAKVAELLGGQP